MAGARTARCRARQRRGSLLFVPAAEEPSPPAESRREILGHEPGSTVVGGVTVHARITGARAGRGRLTAIRTRVTLARPAAGGFLSITRARPRARRSPGVARARLTARFPGVTRARLLARRPAHVTCARLTVRRTARVTCARLAARRPARVTCARLAARRSCGVAPGAALACQAGRQRTTQPTWQPAAQAGRQPAQGAGKPCGATQAAGAAEAGQPGATEAAGTTGSAAGRGPGTTGGPPRRSPGTPAALLLLGRPLLPLRGLGVLGGQTLCCGCGRVQHALQRRSDLGILERIHPARSARVVVGLERRLGDQAVAS